MNKFQIPNFKPQKNINKEYETALLKPQPTYVSNTMLGGVLKLKEEQKLEKFRTDTIKKDISASVDDAASMVEQSYQNRVDIEKSQAYKDKKQAYDTEISAQQAKIDREKADADKAAREAYNKNPMVSGDGENLSYDMHMSIMRSNLGGTESWKEIIQGPALYAADLNAAKSRIEELRGAIEGSKSKNESQGYLKLMPGAVKEYNRLLSIYPYSEEGKKLYKTEIVTRTRTFIGQSVGSGAGQNGVNSKYENDRSKFGGAGGISQPMVDPVGNAGQTLQQVLADAKKDPRSTESAIKAIEADIKSQQVGQNIIAETARIAASGITGQA